MLISDLLVETFRNRLQGASLEDAHEARHLAAAFAAGNSSPCENPGKLCHLDRETMRRLSDATWPGHEDMRELMEIAP